MFRSWSPGGCQPREEQTIPRTAHQPDDNRSQPDETAVPGEDRPTDDRAQPLSSEESRCLCGARVETGGLCVKCRARAAWARRRAPRARPGPAEGPRRQRRSGARGAESRRPESGRPGQRRSRGRRPER
jgi:hypothetical protein